jgi:hypothetical protein
VKRLARERAPTHRAACIARNFRLALVPGTPRTAAVYRKSEAELRAAGLDARCFESEAPAAQWFGS